MVMDIMWWISAVELPALGGLFWLVWRNRRDADAATEDNRRCFERGIAQVREGLAAYKLEVAQSYASLGHLRDTEKRLTTHLERIEKKLDGVQVQATAASVAGGRP
ncbi:hypothetical protein C882_1996 [Caenispirillum salinarum AK4]|uniref:Uncharacterized protein n=1 Tax=Caenispirillum salinarum AK4 TaxID=1238182 RepID=K9GPM4_9PROT|nr:hypothetical protein [Caenispirillum salinarum]EKV27067.1 hypothetical protein C882_1996 [Caenispirillum salinarum AK4]